MTARLTVRLTEGDVMKSIGQNRDRKTINLIEQSLAITRSQAGQIIMPALKHDTRQRKAHDCLERLIAQGQIKRVMHYTQYVYYKRKPKQIDHALQINDVYCSLLTQKKSWYKIQFKWRYEILGGMVVADALIIIDTLPDGKGRQVIFLEVERSPSKRFDKDIQYKRVFDADWVNEEWSVIKGNKAQFPTILIVTEEKLEVNSPLRFIVATPDQVKKDIYSLILRRDGA